ncbi:YqzL family protein [Bacillus shivajii]|nr:YqzL family protein [Bacillus shivajii]UCZ54506.1 YqzL family protein [Bacillus shivajii]
MKDIPWKVFSVTGNIDSYLLYKEVERQGTSQDEEMEEFVLEETDPPTH